MENLNEKLEVMIERNGILTKTDITTQAALKAHAKSLNLNLFSDLEENKKLLQWFFSRSKNPQYRQTYPRIVDDFFKESFDSLEKIQEFFEKRKLFAYFDILEEAPGINYLEKHPKDYLSAANKLDEISSKPERFTIAAHVALNSMMLAILPQDLPKDMLSAMLKPWKPADTVEFISSENIYYFSWANLPCDKLPKLYIIRNEKEYPTELKLKTDSFGDFGIMLPASGWLAAIFVGNKMTCIKGALCVNEHFAACLQDGKVMKYCFDERRSIPQMLLCSEDIYDLALTGNGGVHMLSGNTAIVQGRSEPIQNSIGVYSKDDVYVVFKQDGSTASNIRRLRLKGVIAAAQAEKDILLMTQDGKIHSLSQENYTAEDFWKCMTDRFCNLSENAVEHLSHSGVEILRTRSGEMLCR